MRPAHSLLPKLGLDARTVLEYFFARERISLASTNLNYPGFPVLVEICMLVQVWRYSLANWFCLDRGFTRSNVLDLQSNCSAAFNQYFGCAIDMQFDESIHRDTVTFLQEYQGVKGHASRAS